MSTSPLTVDRPVRARARKPRRTPKAVVMYVLLALAAVGVLLPFYWMVVSSLKTNNEVFTVPISWWPSTPQWGNYVAIWQKSDMLGWLKNTVILSVTITFLQVLTGSFAAYGFSKAKFAGRNILFLIYIATIAVPWQSFMIPQFVLVSHFELSNTLWSLIILQAFAAFGVFLMKQFYDTIPDELSEAARLDGLSEYGIWWRIMMPLSVPAIASLALLTFVNTWNDYLGPLIYLRDPSLWTIQLGLRTFVSQYNADYALIMTGAVISVLPIVVVFLIGQRYFIEGVASTGMKG